MKQYGCLILIVLLSVATGVLIWAGKAGRLRIALADEHWQPAVLQAFPIERSAGTGMQARLGSPVFLRDSDAGRIRLKCTIELTVAAAGEGAMPMVSRGTIQVRSGVALDPEGQQVWLSGAELVDLVLEGEAVAQAGELQPQVATAVAVLLDRFPVYTVERVSELGGWRGSAARFVRGAEVENRQITLIVGW